MTEYDATPRTVGPVRAWLCWAVLILAHGWRWCGQASATTQHILSALSALLLSKLTLSPPVALPRLQHAARVLPKRPSHLALLFPSTLDFDLQAIAQAICWTAAFGIRHISLYDASGKLKQLHAELQQAIIPVHRALFASEASRYPVKITGFASESLAAPSIFIGSQTKKRDPTSASTAGITVYLLSATDGREDIVTTTKRFCAAVLRKECRVDDISVQSFADNLSSGQKQIPDPELAISFGNEINLNGFCPWQIRVTEVHTIISHHALPFASFYKTFQDFSRCDQRLGK